MDPLRWVDRRMYFCWQTNSVTFCPLPIDADDSSFAVPRRKKVFWILRRKKHVHQRSHGKGQYESEYGELHGGAQQVKHRRLCLSYHPVEEQERVLGVCSGLVSETALACLARNLVTDHDKAAVVGLTVNQNLRCSQPMPCHAKPHLP